jgi:hypothetical protein
MKSTIDPQLIYDVFNRFGFPIMRIDQFDRGNFAKIRAELKYDRLSVDYLLEITTRLKSMETSDGNPHHQYRHDSQNHALEYHDQGGRGHGRIALKLDTLWKRTTSS